MDTNNMIAKVLFVIGVIEIIAGVISGMVFANTESYGLYGSYNNFSFTVFFVIVASGVITGMLTIGFSEVIKLLHSINNRVTQKEDDDDLELIE